MSNENNQNNYPDLGSDSLSEDGFDPFATDEELNAAAEGNETASTEEVQAGQKDKPETNHQQLLQSEIPPIFEYAGAKENIDDTAKTFDELRIDKATDFPELDDGKKVSWTVEYGKIIKTVPNPKEITIASMKEEIENSKEFADALKKAKDKTPICKLKPRVTAQSKGTVPAYKGIFTNFDEAIASDKVISFVPGRDGKVYEIRKTEIGIFITPTRDCDLLSVVDAGFEPALPLIPLETIKQIISLFRFMMQVEGEFECLVNIYWDKETKEFIINVPKQIVTKVSVKGTVSDEFTGNRYLHYMDIHSHNSMKASFSEADDSDEKATRVYAVIGRIDKFLPDINVRISNGGKYLKINPNIVFETFEIKFPESWLENITRKGVDK